MGCDAIVWGCHDRHPADSLLDPRPRSGAGFNLPGLGRLMLDALNDRDYPVVSAVNRFFATVVVFVNLLTDLRYASLDPRIRYE